MSSSIELVYECEMPLLRQEQQKLDVDECGETYVIECEGCDKQYEIYFDVD
ncbi:hypothetical protein [Brevibacillus sp. SKDU10]|uniref:hypothetical protein n=1 Tax=Brevibacillus sp. SKDU10 TaxID=1247872 RepID=UPI000A83D147|nr:hypothetical protein [Brevibacillus sp. SKDU10]